MRGYDFRGEVCAEIWEGDFYGDIRPLPASISAAGKMSVSQQRIAVTARCSWSSGCRTNPFRPGDRRP